MKTEVKLGLGIGALLLAVVGAAFVFMPPKAGTTGTGTGAGGTGAGHNGRSAADAVALTNSNNAVVPGPAANGLPSDMTPSTQPTTLPAMGMGGASTQPADGMGGGSGLPSTQPWGSGLGGTGLPPIGGAAMPGTGTGTSGGSMGTGGGMGASAGMGTPSGATPATDWNALLAGAKPIGTPTATTPGGTGAGAMSNGAMSNGAMSNGAGLPPSVGPRGATPPGSNFPQVGGRPAGAGATGLATAGKGATYTVAAGDTLSKISTRFYGSPNFWSKIVQANPGLNPSRMKLGQVITIPEESEVKPTAAAAPRQEKAGGSSLVRDPRSEYQVLAGDSLEKIATKLYGNGTRWREIYDLNKSRIGSSPRNLKVGMTLRLPSTPATPATRAS